MNKPLQARIAGNLFWMQRYRERADYACRMARAIICAPIPPSGEPPPEWNAFLSGLDGSKPRDGSGKPTLQESLNTMLWIRANPASAVESASSAGFNAREAADLLPSEALDRLLLWEGKVLSASESPPDISSLNAILVDSLLSSAAVEGALQSQMRRDAPYRFARLGTLIERADNSARVLFACLQSDSGIAEFGPSPRYRLKLGAIAESFGLTAPCMAFDQRQDPLGMLFGALAFEASRPRSLSHCCAAISEELECLQRERGRSVSIVRDSRAISERISDFADRCRRGDCGEIGPLNEFIADNMKLSREIEVEFGFSK